MITVTIFVKPYVAQYLHKNYGNPVRFPRRSNIRYTFLAVVQKRYQPLFEKQLKRLDSKVEIYLNRQDIEQHGASIRPGIMFHVNSLFEEQIKNEMFFTINRLHYNQSLSINGAIRAWQQSHGFTEEVFSFETIRRGYYDMRKSLIKKPNNAHKAA